MSLPPPPADQLVTSSDLVRHFGLWQERATRAPLYILHRGRPRFVLTSIETMDALCAPHARGATPRTIDPVALLDAISDLVLVADQDGEILATSRAARGHFGAIANTGAPIDGIAAPSGRALLGDTIRRVRTRGIGDRLEIPSAVREGRMLSLAIDPAGPGVAVVAHDATRAQDEARASATEIALCAALHDAAGVACATITLRGYVSDPQPALCALVGIAPEESMHIPFVALATVDARPALGAALEQAIAGQVPAALDLALLVHRAAPIAVRIGLAPIRSSIAVTAVAAVILAERGNDSSGFSVLNRP